MKWLRRTIEWLERVEWKVVCRADRAVYAWRSNLCARVAARNSRANSPAWTAAQLKAGERASGLIMVAPRPYQGWFPTTLGGGKA